MRWKSFTIGVIVAAGLFWIWPRDPEPDLAKRLAQEQARRQSETSISDGDAEFLPRRWQLTPQTRAVKNEGRDTWFVEYVPTEGGPTGRRSRAANDEAAANRTLVQLPFPPPSDGAFPSFENRASAETGDLTRTNDLGTRDDPTITTARESAGSFVGADACAECHQQRHASFSQTAHYQTSAVVATEKILGPLVPPGNQVATQRDGLRFEVNAVGQRVFQRVHLADWHLDIPMDIVTGSAKTGQSFLYWYGDRLFQDHLSYMPRHHEWFPSPGFGNDIVDYSRPIRAVCLECHVTFIRPTRPPNHYDQDSLITGISCERCHGPGSAHVAYHNRFPDRTEPAHIVHPAQLTRAQQLDICAQCHSGLFELSRPAFSFRPGDQIDHFHRLLDPEADGVGGIHTSNQLTRLAKSRCFTETEMTCTTCHDPHQFQRGDVTIMNRKCAACHDLDDCGRAGDLGQQIAQRCVECHMPISENRDIIMQGSRGSFVMPMTDHYIRVVEETRGSTHASSPQRTDGTGDADSETPAIP